MEQTQSAKKLNERKFFTVLPVLVLPFLTLAFWAMGGGRGSAAKAALAEEQGFNMELPGAAVREDKELTKLGHYERAESDSAKLREQIKNDPYYRLSFSPAEDEPDWEEDAEANESPYANSGLRSGPYAGGYSDPNEARVMEKLAELNEALSRPVEEDTQQDDPTAFQPEPVSISSDLDRLEQMMHIMQQGNEEEDPEMQELNRMLQSILDIQHPERVQERLRQASKEQSGAVFSVNAESREDYISGWEGGTPEQELFAAYATAHQNGFYSLEDPAYNSVEANAIRAVVHESQTLVSGSTIKLRLLNDVFINGTRIPKDHFVFGTASLNGERLEVNIKSIRSGESLFPVSLSVHDADGLEGIYIPGAISRDVAKQSGDRAVQSFGMTTLNPTIGGQLAGAGIETARGLLSKKIKLVKVTVKAGYQVWLKDEKQQQ